MEKVLGVLHSREVGKLITSLESYDTDDEGVDLYYVRSAGHRRAVELLHSSGIDRRGPKRRAICPTQAPTRRIIQRDLRQAGLIWSRSPRGRRRRRAYGAALRLAPAKADFELRRANFLAWYYSTRGPYLCPQASRHSPHLVAQIDEHYHEEDERIPDNNDCHESSPELERMSQAQRVRWATRLAARHRPSAAPALARSAP